MNHEALRQIVAGARCRVGKRRPRLVDGEHFLVRAVAEFGRLRVGMMLAHQLPMAPLDLRHIRVARHAQNIVKIGSHFDEELRRE